LGMSGNTLNVWDWSSNQILLTLNWSPQTMPSAAAYAYTSVKFLANGLLAAPTASFKVNIWNVTSGQVKLSLSHQGVYALEQLNNSNLVSVGSNRLIKIWSTITGQLIYQALTPSYQYALKQTNIANYLASASKDHNVYIFDTNSLTTLYTLSGHGDEVYLLDLTPSGLLLSGSYDYTVKLWNVTNSNPLSSATFSYRPACLKVVSSNQLVVGFPTTYIKIVNISSANVLTIVSQVNLITNSQVNDMRLTIENILLLDQSDGYVFFLDTNTFTFQQALLPDTSGAAAHWSLDLIG
jgi:WD40 repeat protein